MVSTFEKFLKFVERASYYKYSGNTRKDALDLLVGNEGLVGYGMVLATVIRKWFSFKILVQ